MTGEGAGNRQAAKKNSARTNSYHQPHVTRTDIVPGCDLGHALEKRVFAFQNLKTNSFHFSAYQCRVDFVNLDLIDSGLGSMGGKAIVCYDQTATRFERPENLPQHWMILLKMMVRIHH